MSLDILNIYNCAIVLIGIVIILYLFAKNKQTYWSKRGVFSPPANWFFGHFRDAIFVRESAAQVFANLYKSYKKDVLGTYVMQKPFLLVCNPDIIKDIFVRDFHVFPNHYFATKRERDIVGSKNLFSIDNPEWKILRQKLTPTFSTVKMKSFFNFMLESAANMQEHLIQKIPDDKTISIDMKIVMTKFTTDIISSLSFGILTNSFKESVPEFYNRSRTPLKMDIYGAILVFANFFFPKLNDILNLTSLRGDEDYFRRIFWLSMNEREKSGNKRGDLIDSLLTLKNQEQNSEFKFEGDRLLAQSIIFLMAGLETSSFTISYALFEIAKNPEIQKKVRDEIASKIGRNAFTYEHTSEMTYLNQIISETLRLYPPVPVIDRIPVEDYKIPGTDIIIEKGTPVFIPLLGMHTNSEYFHDPFKYDPDRFSEERKLDIKPFTYMPFGNGPRACIGMRTGILQVLVGIVTILRDYEVSVNPNYTNELSKRGIFATPKNGVHLNMKKSPIII